MTAFTNYLIEANLGLIFFSAVYFFLLHRETQFKVKRAYLLGAMLASVVFPLIEFQFLVPKISNANFIPQVYLPEIIIGTDTAPVEGNPSTVNFWNITMWTYAIIAAVLLMRFLIQLGKLFYYLRSQTFYQDGNFKIAESPVASSTFSFFHYIVVGNAGQLEKDEKEKIIQHEKTHAASFHSFDIILTELFIIGFWFNPLVYTLKKQLITLHEFEADQQSIESSQTNSYCNMLARVSLMSAGFTFVNHFNNSLTVKRIAMINTEKSKIKNWKYIILIPAFALGLFLVACEDKVMTEAVELAQKSTTINDYPKAIQDAVTTLQKAHPERKYLVIEPDDAGGVDKAEGVKSALAKIDPHSIQSVTVIKDIKDDDGRLRAFVIIVYDENAKKIFETAAKDGVYSAVEEAPTFPGGTAAMRTFFQQNIGKNASEIAKQANVSGGKVYLQFIIATDGSLSDFEVIKGLSPELEQEALRVAKLMPNWIPGKQNGTDVKARYVIPIQFGESDEKNNATNINGKIVGQPLNVTYNVTKDGTKRIISGKVVGSNGKPLQGATLVVVGGTSGTITTAEGNFAFQTVEATEQLAVSFVGYETKVISF